MRGEALMLGCGVGRLGYCVRLVSRRLLPCRFGLLRTGKSGVLVIGPKACDEYTRYDLAMLCLLLSDGSLLVP